ALTLFLLSFTHPPSTFIFTLSLHDALPIFPTYINSNNFTCISFIGKCIKSNRHFISYFYFSNINFCQIDANCRLCFGFYSRYFRSEEHTSELQSRGHLVCRLLLEKKNIKK